MKLVIDIDFLSENLTADEIGEIVKQVSKEHKQTEGKRNAWTKARDAVTSGDYTEKDLEMLSKYRLSTSAREDKDVREESLKTGLAEARKIRLTRLEFEEGPTLGFANHGLESRGFSENVSDSFEVYYGDDMEAITPPGSDSWFSLNEDDFKSSVGRIELDLVGGSVDIANYGERGHRTI